MLRCVFGFLLSVFRFPLSLALFLTVSGMEAGRLPCCDRFSLSAFRFPFSAFPGLIPDGEWDGGGADSVLRIEAAAFAEGKAEGEVMGEAKGQQHLVLRQLTRRFGLLTPEREAQIRALTPSHVLALANALFDLETLADLDAWLAQL